MKYYFHGNSALTDSSHFSEKSDNKGNSGMWQPTDGHADSDPETLHLHVWRPPDMTRKIFQDIMPESALLEMFFFFKTSVI